MSRSRHDCIEWTGCRSKDGYGVRRFNGKTCRAHRVAWELAHGPIPQGLTIDHLCRNRACQNVHHMELVTRAENMRRAAAARTHCQNGHAFNEQNTYLRGIGKGRTCRTCNHQAVNKYRRRKAKASPAQPQESA